MTITAAVSPPAPPPAAPSTTTAAPPPSRWAAGAAASCTAFISLDARGGLPRQRPGGCVPAPRVHVQQKTP
ncbi:hypothetical protein QJS66_22015 [Kocuria rhizophila]|nr:hypothetical protein QJS66_22015 [Kocuria rhizophila]